MITCEKLYETCVVKYLIQHDNCQHSKAEKIPGIPHLCTKKIKTTADISRTIWSCEFEKWKPSYVSALKLKFNWANSCLHHSHHGVTGLKTASPHARVGLCTSDPPQMPQWWEPGELGHPFFQMANTRHWYSHFSYIHTTTSSQQALKDKLHWPWTIIQHAQRVNHCHIASMIHYPDIHYPGIALLNT